MQISLIRTGKLIQHSSCLHSSDLYTREPKNHSLWVRLGNCQNQGSHFLRR